MHSPSVKGLITSPSKEQMSPRLKKSPTFGSFYSGFMGPEAHVPKVKKNLKLDEIMKAGVKLPDLLV
jgi:hypothetical protein